MTSKTKKPRTKKAQPAYDVIAPGPSLYDRPSDQLILEALRASAGLKTVAAKRLRCARSSLYRWIEESPKLKEAMLDIKEELIDLGEGKLLEAVKKGDRESIRFFLRCQARDRGYIESHQITGPNDGPVKVQAVPHPLATLNLAAMPLDKQVEFLDTVVRLGMEKTTELLGSLGPVIDAKTE
jgi:hypothetical protein